jgi:hypothetical protein
MAISLPVCLPIYADEALVCNAHLHPQSGNGKNAHGLPFVIFM